MGQRRLTPPAAALMASIRGVGYDPRTAIADLIDNSIAAGAGTVAVRFSWAGQASVVSIVDDGHGMDAEELDRAMTLGGRNPLETRKPTDLGRFGLGLKTASLSQCSRLLVASRRAGSATVIRVWDLDIVRETDDWIVDDSASADEMRLITDFEAKPAGTLVIWSKLDRLTGNADEKDSEARLSFQRTAREVEAHLAMTFHRFLEGTRPKLRIFVNGDTDEFRVHPWDPFCSTHPATQHMPEVRRAFAAGAVVLQGFVLPHKDRFSQDEYSEAGGASGWASQQGFYVYRNQRLLVPGSWLGLGRPRAWIRDEQHKLARIQLDLPNSLDLQWSIDIKKSTAYPPLALRDWLSRNAEHIRNEAKEVFVHRGNRAPASSRAEFSPTWFAEAGTSPKYRINRNHPLVSEALSGSGAKRSDLERVLRVLEATVPVHRIWLDIAEKPETPVPARGQLSEQDVERLARDLITRLMAGQKLSARQAVQSVKSIEPFDQYPEILASLETIDAK